MSASHSVASLAALAFMGAVGGKGEGGALRDPDDSCMSSELGKSPPLVSMGDCEAGDIASMVPECSISMATSEAEDSLDTLVWWRRGTVEAAGGERWLVDGLLTDIFLGVWL